MVSLRAILVIVVIAVSVWITQVTAIDVEDAGDELLCDRQVVCGSDGLIYP